MRARARRKSGKKMVGKPRRPSVKELDDICREYTFKRDDYQCLRCGKSVGLQWAHVYSRRYKTVRWNPWGSMCLCSGCHLWWHHNPVDAIKWLELLWGEKRLAELRLERRAAKPPSAEEVLRMLEAQ